MATTTETFQPGDVVQLKSGGMLMTVFEVQNNSVYVYYSDTQGHPQVRNNPIQSIVLQKFTPSQKTTDEISS